MDNEIELYKAMLSLVQKQQEAIEAMQDAVRLQQSSIDRLLLAQMKMADRVLALEK